MAKALLLSLFFLLSACSDDPVEPEPQKEKLLIHTPKNISKAYESANEKDKEKLRILTRHPIAKWIGGWTLDVEKEIKDAVDPEGKKYLVIVLYNIPYRDCGGHSKGGVKDYESYKKWIDLVFKGIGTSPVIVILEPDAIPLHITKNCMNDKLFDALNYAVTTLQKNKTKVYIDAGHPKWVSDLNKLKSYLEKSGLQKASGFSLNVSNFHTSLDNLKYGQSLSSLTKKPFVIDTSRNGNGSNGEWCNPTGRKLGNFPTLDTSSVKDLDAYLWIKVPGESDGKCNGGPKAGEFWIEYALKLIEGK